MPFIDFNNAHREDRLAVIVRFIDDYVNDHGYSPTVREVASRTQVASTETAKRDLDLLAYRKWITVAPRLSRTARVTDLGRSAALESA